jgi:hypothetical protein
MSSGGRSFV